MQGMGFDGQSTPFDPTRHCSDTVRILRVYPIPLQLREGHKLVKQMAGLLSSHCLPVLRPYTASQGPYTQLLQARVLTKAGQHVVHQQAAACLGTAEGWH